MALLEDLKKYIECLTKNVNVLDQITPKIIKKSVNIAANTEAQPYKNKYDDKFS